MQIHQAKLSQLIHTAKTQGYLTYEDAVAYLPDDGNGTQQLDELIQAVEDHQLELLPARRAPGGGAGRGTAQQVEPEGPSLLGDDPVELPRASADPIRTYLSQMAKIPLLSREEEIAMA
ncbi:MAG: RNA polymerase subunit sigma-70, partial [Planctomycetales bacterium]|nr:RNA polymerase subunit sigma-70 [Planctomycetales bacterium]